MKKFVSVVLAFVLTFSATYGYADVFDTAEYVCEVVSEPTVSYVGGEWAIMALARSNFDVPEGYFENYYANVKQYLGENNGILHDKKYTEYSRVILALTAIGANPQNIAGYNLLTPLADYDKTIWQGINGSIWALIALDSNNYDIPKNVPGVSQSSRDMYVNEILNSQCTDGGWSISGNLPSEADITAMALCALSKYRNRTEVSTAVEKALEFLSETQCDDGGFLTSDGETAESTAQVITALCELGISPSDARFTKNGITLYDNIMMFACENGSFKHFKTDIKSNQMTTEQVFYALVAYERFKEGKNSLYDMTDVKSELKNITEENSALNSVVKKSTVLYEKSFTDIINHPLKSEIEALASRGIINGKTQEVFEPDANVTRAEFAALVTKSLGIAESDRFCFEDIKKDDWYYGYVASAYINKIIMGVSETQFNPNGFITKEEAAVMICRAAKLCGCRTEYTDDDVRDILSVFVDYKEVSDWAKNGLAFCCDKQLLPTDEICINPQHFATRAEISSILYNLMEYAELL